MTVLKLFIFLVFRYSYKFLSFMSFLLSNYLLNLAFIKITSHETFLVHKKYVKQVPISYNLQKQDLEVIITCLMKHSYCFK